MPITERDLDQLLTVSEAASLLGVSRATLYRIIDDREIDVTRVGSGRGRIRVPRRAVLDLLNRRTVRAVRRRPAS